MSFKNETWIFFAEKYDVTVKFILYFLDWSEILFLSWSTRKHPRSGKMEPKQKRLRSTWCTNGCSRKWRRGRCCWGENIKIKLRKILLKKWKNLAHANVCVICVGFAKSIYILGIFENSLRRKPSSSSKWSWRLVRSQGSYLH